MVKTGFRVGLSNKGWRFYLQIQFSTPAKRGLSCLTRLNNGENGLPVGQSITRLGLVFESFKKLVNGLSHGNWGKFTSTVCCSSDTAELKITSSISRG